MGAELVVELAETDADETRLDELTRGLRQELLELDVDDVSTASRGAAPEGTRGLEVAAVGTLLVMLKDNIPLIQQVVTAVRGWLDRGAKPGVQRSLKLTLNGQTLELSAATDAQQQALVDQFVKAAASPAAG